MADNKRPSKPARRGFISVWTGIIDLETALAAEEAAATEVVAEKVAA